MPPTIQAAQGSGELHEVGSSHDGLPTGTVTFLFADIEGSTRLVETLGEAWTTVLERHHAPMRDAAAGSPGKVVAPEVTA